MMRWVNLERLYRWFREGPGDPGEDGTLAFMIGMMLWWRMLALAVLLGCSMLAVTYVGYRIGDPTVAAFIGLFVGLVVGGWILQLSPMYNVTKNY